MIFTYDHVLSSISHHQETIMLMPRMALLKSGLKGEKEIKCYLVQHEKKGNQLEEYKYALRQRVKWFINYQVHLDCLVIFIL